MDTQNKNTQGSHFGGSKYIGERFHLRTETQYSEVKSSLFSQCVGTQSKAEDCLRARREHGEHQIQPLLRKPERSGDLTLPFWGSQAWM